MARRRYIVDFNGLVQEIHGRELRPLKSPCDAGGDAWLVSDLAQTLARVDRVDAPPRYAEMVVRKRLQDAGEFAEPVTILTHWKRRVAGERSDIYYTAVPEYLMQQYERQLGDCAHNVLLFPVHAVLWAALRGLPGRQPTAVVFVYDRFAELLIGTRNQAHGALRITAYDTGDAAMEGLWESVRQELAQHAERLHIDIKRVLGFSWQLDPEAFEGHLADTARALGAESLLLPATELGMGDERFLDTLPGALDGLRARQSVSPGWERLSFVTRRAAPWATAAAAAVVAALAGGGWWLGERTATLENRIVALQRDIDASPVSNLPPPPPYAETMAFAHTLERVSAGPSYRRLLNELSAALPEDLRIDALKVVHGRDTVGLEVFGSAVTGFRTAQFGHQGFLAALRRQGYRVEGQQFSTRIGSSDFKITLELPRP